MTYQFDITLIASLSMAAIIGSQDADPVTGEEDQGLMEAFMAYHKAVRDAGPTASSTASTRTSTP
jgi:hypothetical protein